MPNNSSDREWETYLVSISLAGRVLRAEIPVPAGPLRLAQMLPAVHALADAIAGHAIRTTEEKGQRVSCSAGCAACCRKLVPLSEAEAWRLRKIMDALPDTSRSAVAARFKAAGQALDHAGLLTRLVSAEGLGSDEFWQIGLLFFPLWLACPFLEDERCLIYDERPLACRECLVVSPPADCFPGSTATTVQHLILPCSLSAALARIHSGTDAAAERWVPLIVMPEWTKSHAEPQPERTGPEWLRAALGRLGRR